VEVGRTRRGVSLKINEELMTCDLKIGIGTILPHLYAGYSGGGKIVLPGLAHIDTIDQFHSSLEPDQKGRKGDLNPLCGDIEDAVRLTGLDFKVDVLVNTRGRVIDLYAGHPVTTYREGIKAAERIYKSDLHEEQDIVLSNAHLKVNEGDIAMLLGFRSLKRRGGTCVLLMNSPTGQMTHYLMRSSGKFIGGRQYVTRSHLPEDCELIVLSEYKDRTSFDSFDSEARILWMKRWDEVLDYLRAKHQGKVDLCVYPDGTIQYV
jgi:nickel-dependent lactate racemase